MHFFQKIIKKNRHCWRSSDSFVNLSDRCIEVAAEEERLGGKEETEHTSAVDQHHRPEGGGIAHEFGDDTADEDAESHANVPRDEDGRVGRAALIVSGHIDSHILEGGPHVTVAETNQQGRTVVAEPPRSGYK